MTIESPGWYHGPRIQGETLVEERNRLLDENAQLRERCEALEREWVGEAGPDPDPTVRLLRIVQEVSAQCAQLRRERDEAIASSLAVEMVMQDAGAPTEGERSARLAILLQTLQPKHEPDYRRRLEEVEHQLAEAQTRIAELEKRLRVYARALED